MLFYSLILEHLELPRFLEGYEIITPKSEINDDTRTSIWTRPYKYNHERNIENY